MCGSLPLVGPLLHQLPQLQVRCCSLLRVLRDILLPANGRHRRHKSRPPRTLHVLRVRRSRPRIPPVHIVFFPHTQPLHPWLPSFLRRGAARPPTVPWGPPSQACPLVAPGEHLEVRRRLRTPRPTRTTHITSPSWHTRSSAPTPVCRRHHPRLFFFPLPASCPACSPASRLTS